jgi:predicted TPR repeat methyltransferase
MQNNNIEKLYSDIANIYDPEFEEKAEYQVPNILQEIFYKYQIHEGVVLDLGCGTGKLSKYIGHSFLYEGIDLSESMLKIAKDRGYKTHKGDMLEILKTFENKSVDHVVALSSLYFVKDFEILIKEVERVARISYFFTLEQFSDSVKEIMSNRGIDIINHPIDLIDVPSEEFKNVHLWTRPNTDDKIFGNVVFKILS